ncbi:MAG: energy transducer TonB, partial [Nitrosomonadales bacterium]|nr:energy transducer TonB [Nitrosomonadales bacterium]
PQVVSNYSNLLRAHIAKHKKYPRIAQRRKMQGEVVIEIQIKGDGSLISKNIQKSSGHKVLDKEGMNMMEKSKPFPVPPEAMKDSVTTVLVPIAFNLI